MPLSGPNLRTQLADRTKVNAQNVAPSPNTSAGLVVSVMLTYNKQFVPEDLFDALEAKYGSGKVVSDQDSVGRTGPFHFRIIP